MTIISQPRRITFRGGPATLAVLRNNGFAWGRIETQDGRRFDVGTGDEDLYELDDETALDNLEAFALDVENLTELAPDA